MLLRAGSNFGRSSYYFGGVIYLPETQHLLHCATLLHHSMVESMVHLMLSLLRLETLQVRCSSRGHFPRALSCPPHCDTSAYFYNAQSLVGI